MRLPSAIETVGAGSLSRIVPVPVPLPIVAPGRCRQIHDERFIGFVQLKSSCRLTEIVALDWPAGIVRIVSGLAT